MSKFVAQTDLLCIHPSGRRGKIIIQIGQPYQEAADDAACPVALVGLEDRLPDIRGVDTLHALCIAIRLARTLLEDFVARGGQLYFSQDEPERISVGLLFGDTSSDGSTDAA